MISSYGFTSLQSSFKHCLLQLCHFLKELGALSFPTGFVNGVEMEELEDIVF